MGGGIWVLVAILVLGSAGAVRWALSESMVFAAYPGTFEFTGIQRWRGTNYFGFKWLPNPGETGSCPLVIHMDGADIGATEWADPTRLSQKGWAEAPFLPLAPEWTAVVGRTEPAPGLPRVVKYAYGDLRVSTQHTEGALTGVWVFVVEPDEVRIAQGRPSGHELMARRVGATRYAMSLGGRRITLPITQAELVQAFGPPEHQRKDY